MLLKLCIAKGVLCCISVVEIEWRRKEEDVATT